MKSTAPASTTALLLGLVACLSNPAFAGSVPDELLDEAERFEPAEQGVEPFAKVGIGVSYLFSGRDHSPTPAEVSAADDALQVGALPNVEVGVHWRESGLGLGVFYEAHRRSTEAEVPFSRTSGGAVETFASFEPTLTVHTTGLALTRRGRFGSSDWHWTGGLGIGYVFSLLEVSRSSNEVQGGYRQTGEGAALRTSLGLDWQIAPHFALASDLRYAFGSTTTNQLVADGEDLLLGVAEQRIDHLGWTLGLRLGL